MKHTATRITRLAVALCAMALCSFLFVDPAAGQFVEEWEKSENDGNRPTYISDGDYNARGIAYGMVDDGNGNMVGRVFVASNANGAYRVYVVDPDNGMLLDSLDVSGVSGGSRVLTDVAVSNDGVIIACNEANNIFIGGGQDFKCYRWDSLTDSPTQVISFLPPDADGDGTEDWVGSHITVTGSASDNSLSLHTAAVNNSPNVYHFSTSDNGSTFEPDTALAGDSSTVNVEGVYPMPSGHLHTAIEEPATLYNESGDSLDAVPAGVADSLVSLQVFEANGETFLAGAKNNFGGGSPAGSNSRVRVANITDGVGNATMYGQTPDLGDTQQFQGNGDVDVRVNDDGTATFFFLSTNNGIAAFTANEGPFGPATAAPTVDGQTDDADYIDLGMVTSDQISSPTDYSGEGLVKLRSWATSDSLFVAVEGKTNVDDSGNFRDIMIWVDVVGGPSGIAEGDSLPAGSDGFSPFSAIEGMTMEMETDYGFRLTGSGDGSGNAFASFVDYTDLNSDGTAPDAFEGTLSGDGSPLKGGATGGTYAYLDASSLVNADENNSGFEFSVPMDSLGATLESQFQFFVAYGNVDGGTNFSAHIIPDDGQSMAYDPAQDWTQVSGTQATVSQTLPVELASFEARRSSGGAVLTWRTASETNNAGFAVQHAAGTDGSFEQIGWVEGSGTTTEAQTYRFVAEDLSAGTHRFRLKQQDVDGTTSLSEAVTLTVKPEGPVAVQKVAPNPVQGTGTLRFTPRKSGQVTVSLYDVLGRKVRTLHEGRVSGGQSTRVTLDASELSSGVYFLRVTGDDFTKTQRVTVVR